jgi:hypothetical protein
MFFLCKAKKEKKENIKNLIATQKAEIRRITVQRQPGQIVFETLS